MSNASPIDWERLKAVDFEELVYHLVSDLGFQDVSWRKGTPKKSTSPDSGRDIEARWKRQDPDGDEFFERWFVQAKHYNRGLGVKQFKDAFDWAEAEQPDVLLIATSSYLTKDATSWIQSYERQKRQRFRVRYWDRSKLERLSAKACEKKNEEFDPIAVARPGAEGQRLREMERLREDVDQALRM